MVATEKEDSVRHQNLPGQEDEESLETPSTTINIVTIEDVELVPRRKASVFQQEEKVMELTVNVTNDNNFGIRVEIIDVDDVTFFVEDFGSGEDEGVKDVDGQHRR